ncbi:MAG: sigma-70 family RNA polymerase sigma factor [Planctomycetota bacterium]
MSERIQDLVRRARKGEQSSIERLMKMYRPGIESMIEVRVGDADLAQDLTQEAFLRALDGLHRLRDSTAFGRWLRAIAKRTAMDFIRKQPWHRRTQRWSSVCRDSLVDPREPIDALCECEEHHQRDRTRAWLLAGIGRLPRQDRDILQLRYMTLLSYEEISQVVGVSSTAIKQRLYRARSKLKLVLRPPPKGKRRRANAE